LLQQQQQQQQQQPSSTSSFFSLLLQQHSYVIQWSVTNIPEHHDASGVAALGTSR
jgi:hypothetical protein